MGHQSLSANDVLVSPEGWRAGDRRGGVHALGHLSFILAARRRGKEGILKFFFNFYFPWISHLKLEHWPPELHFILLPQYSLIQNRAINYFQGFCSDDWIRKTSHPAWETHTHPKCPQPASFCYFIFQSWAVTATACFLKEHISCSRKWKCTY